MRIETLQRLFVVERSRSAVQLRIMFRMLAIVKSTTRFLFQHIEMSKVALPCMRFGVCDAVMLGMFCVFKLLSFWKFCYILLRSCMSVHRVPV